MPLTTSPSQGTEEREATVVIRNKELLRGRGACREARPAGNRGRSHLAGLSQEGTESDLGFVDSKESA